jgi:hypothetical protein
MGVTAMKIEKADRYRASVFAGKYLHLNALLAEHSDLVRQVKGVYEVAPYALSDETIAFYESLVADPEAFDRFVAGRCQPCDECRIGAGVFEEAERAEIETIIARASGSERFFQIMRAYDVKFRGTRAEGHNDKDLRDLMFARAWAFAARLRDYYGVALNTRNRARRLFRALALPWVGTLAAAPLMTALAPLMGISAQGSYWVVGGVFVLGPLIQHLADRLVFQRAEASHRIRTDAFKQKASHESLRLGTDFKTRQEQLLKLMEQMLERVAHAHARIGDAEDGARARYEMACWLRLAGYIRERIAANGSFLEEQDWNVAIAFGALRDKAEHDYECFTILHPIHSVKKTWLRKWGMGIAGCIVVAAAAAGAAVQHNLADQTYALPTYLLLGGALIGAAASLLGAARRACQLDDVFDDPIEDEFVEEVSEESQLGLWHGDYRARFDTLLVRLAHLLRRGW